MSTFSKTLTLFLGLLVVAVQYAESKGVRIVPYDRVQKYVRGVDMKSLVLDNVALKISFGAAFAMAGFAQLN